MTDLTHSTEYFFTGDNYERFYYAPIYHVFMLNT